MKYIFLALVALIWMGCSTVTITPGGEPKLSNAPDYESRRHFYFWGLVGDEEVYVKDICSTDKPPRQMQSENTAMDSVFALLTFGIYSPRTVKVWCSDEGGMS